MRKRIELHGSSFYPKGLGFTLVTAEVARPLPDAIGSYKGSIPLYVQLAATRRSLLLQRMLGCSRAQRSPTRAGVYSDCCGGCEVDPARSAVLQGLGLQAWEMVSGGASC